MNPFDVMFAAYIEAALFSTNDETDESGGLPLDRIYTADDLDPASAKELRAKVKEFGLAHGITIETVGHGDWKRAGHDLWFTQNGHGCGFWDGDWPEPAATALTEAAKALGSVTLTVGDDGRIYAG